MEAISVPGFFMEIFLVEIESELCRIVHEYRGFPNGKESIQSLTPERGHNCNVSLKAEVSTDDPKYH